MNITDYKAYVRHTFFASVFLGVMSSNTGHASPRAPAAEADARAQLARYLELQSEMAKLEHAILETPWPFPASVDANAQPERVLPLLTKAATELRSPIQFEAPDCSEFPCIYFAELASCPVFEAAGPRSTTPPWPASFAKREADIWDAPSLSSPTLGRNQNVACSHIADCDRAIYAVTAYDSPLAELVAKRVSQRVAKLKSAHSECRVTKKP